MIRTLVLLLAVLAPSLAPGGVNDAPVTHVAGFGCSVQFDESVDPVSGDHVNYRCASGCSTALAMIPSVAFDGVSTGVSAGAEPARYFPYRNPAPEPFPPRS